MNQALNTNAIDDGVALAAIQGFNQKLEETVKEKDARVVALENDSGS